MREKILTRLRCAVVICIVCGTLGGTALASGELIPVGQPVGLCVELAGILVAGTTEVETDSGAVSPASEAGIRTGDVICAVNGQTVEDAAGLAAAVAGLGPGDAELTVIRNGRELSLSVTPAVEADGVPRLGLWLRDGITGIGTVTYVDPETGVFGALGHGINDASTGALLPVEGGSVSPARIVDVRRGRIGEPGELSGSFSTGDVIGNIRENTGRGIFGELEPQSGLRRAVPVAAPDEIVSGPATILACVDGGEAREYEVEIARAGFAAGDGRDLTVRVTDPELLALTGGIVQGMSGSPILQNGRLVGAVTHVLTADPARGYGITAEHMLEASAEAA